MTKFQPPDVVIAYEIRVEGAGAPPPDPGQLRFESSAVGVQENGGAIQLRVQRTGGSNGAVSVDFATSDGSARAGSDYAAQSGTLSWDDNDGAAKSLSIPILDDSVMENSETINVLLSNPAGGAGLGAPNAATVTIADNDEGPRPGQIAFSGPSFNAGEGDGFATLSVERTGGHDGAVSVDFAISEGSALQGLDYLPNGGSLSWADGDGVPKTFQVELLDDDEPENTETLNAMLSNVSGGATLGRSSATLEISDNDAPPGSCVADGFNLCLNRDGRFRVQLDYRFPDGTTGVGQVVDIGKRDSGLMFFLDENNIEMLVKVLDACDSPFESFWVFYAATTNVEFTLRVTDTVAGETREFFNPLGNPAAPVQDTQAFKTCP